MQRLIIVKKKTVAEDGKVYYGLFLVDRMLRKYVRVLTFKDDRRGYGVLETISYYIGENKVDKYFDEKCDDEKE